MVLVRDANCVIMLGVSFFGHCRGTFCRGQQIDANSIVQIVRSGSGAFGAFVIAVEDLVPRPFKLCYSRRFTPQSCDALRPSYTKTPALEHKYSNQSSLPRCGEV